MNASSKHFCILPWVHFQLSPSGDVRPCCRSDYSFVYGSTRTSTIEQIWNDRPARELRSSLLSGDSPPQCRDCHELEARGAYSTRQQSNDEFADAFDRLPGTAPDGRVPMAPFLSLDLRFSSLCNFKCRPCGPEVSTAWAAEARREGLRPPVPLQRALPPEEMEAFLDRSIPRLRRVYFAGGEPLLQADHYRFLEKLLRADRGDVILIYNSNFSSLDLQEWSAMDLWRKFRKVHVQASLDGAGRQGEYLRSGMHWEGVVDNFERLRRDAPGVRFSILATITAMNVLHITEAIRIWTRLGMVGADSPVEFNLLRDPAHLSINILDEAERNLVRRRYLDFLDSYRDEASTALHAQAWRGLERILASFSPPKGPRDREKFGEITSRLDRIRSEDFSELFPELASLLTNYPVSKVT